MSLITKLLGIDKLLTRQINSVLLGGTANYGKFNDAYSTNDTVYTVVKKIGLKCSNVPMYAYIPKNESNLKRYKSVPTNNIQRLTIEKVKSLDEVDTSSPLSLLIQKPNQLTGSNAFWEGVFSFRVLRGEAFIWKNRGGIDATKRRFQGKSF